MSDEERVNQALAELWDIVKCRCHESYTGRGLHDPDCQCDSTDAVQTVADRIEQLKHRLFQCATDLQIYMDAYAVSEAKLAECEVRLRKVVEALEWQANQPEAHPFMAQHARATLAAVS